MPLHERRKIWQDMEKISGKGQTEDGKDAIRRGMSIGEGSFTALYMAELMRK